MSNVIRVQPVFDDVDAIRTLVEGAGPFVPLALAAQTKEEQERSGRVAVPFVPPWFRRDLATHGEVHVKGAAELLEHDRFRAAAAQVFPGAEIVEPTTVYVNVMGPVVYPFRAHLDIPVFTFASRRNCPVWLLQTMLSSGLFETERVRLATAVTWFFDGPGGDFHYWPDGPDGSPKTESPPFSNVAVVADNETLYHGVGPLGPSTQETLTDLTIDAVINTKGDGRWTIHDPDEVASYRAGETRITISWKAEVFATEDERAARKETKESALPVDRIVSRFMDDLGSSGQTPDTPDDPLHDARWIEQLQAAYPLPRAPKINALG